MNIDLLILKKNRYRKKENPEANFKYLPNTKKLNVYLSVMNMIKKEPEKFKQEYINNI